MLDGCTLSNSLVSGVHNIPKQRLLMELQMRRIPIPKRGIAQSTSRASLHLLRKASIGARVAKYFHVQGTGNTLFLGSVLAYRDDNNGGMYTIHYEDGDTEDMDTGEFTIAHHRAKDEEAWEVSYVLTLREILVKRLKEEEEYERLLMYSRDVRFERDINRPKWDHGRILVCMLHCLMRMNEKVLFLLYFAAMKRCVGDTGERNIILDLMTLKIRTIGNLSAQWKHTLGKDKHGNDKLLPLKMNYDKSKRIFNFKVLTGLYELIDIALGTVFVEVRDDAGEVVPNDNDRWRAFIVSYLNCMELVTLNREYTPNEIDDLDRCCKKMYHLLVTTIGGLEAITNYFHLIGSGHVVWMVRRYGNMWRFRNEGVEAFNAIVSLRHNKNNKKGGYKKTRKGEPIRKCAEFWSLGQWLGRWSLWQLGYGDSMQRRPAYMRTPATDDAFALSDSDIDESYNPVEDIETESSAYDSDENCHGSASQTFEVVITSEDAVEEHWNGVWYGTSEDYDLDSHDGDCVLETDDNEGSSCSDSDESDVSGLEAIVPPPSPSQLSARHRRTNGFYGRACNTRLCANAVHAAS